MIFNLFIVHCLLGGHNGSPLYRYFKVKGTIGPDIMHYLVGDAFVDFVFNVNAGFELIIAFFYRYTFTVALPLE